MARHIPCPWSTPTSPGVDRIRDDEDDLEDDRPRRKKRKKSANNDSTLVMILVGGGAILFVLFMAAAGVGGYFLFRSAADRHVANRQKRANGNVQNFNVIAKGKMVLDQQGVLAAADPPDPTPELADVGARMKVHQVSMQAGTTYVITLESDDFDAYLRLESPTGEVLAEDDDGGADLDARIVFRATQAGMHRVIATSFDGFTGRFRLTVQEAD